MQLAQRMQRSTPGPHLTPATPTHDTHAHTHTACSEPAQPPARPPAHRTVTISSWPAEKGSATLMRSTQSGKNQPSTSRALAAMGCSVPTERLIRATLRCSLQDPGWPQRSAAKPAAGRTSTVPNSKVLESHHTGSPAKWASAVALPPGVLSMKVPTDT